jgi:hypothetical protein
MSDKDVATELQGCIHAVYGASIIRRHPDREGDSRSIK